ncbi:MAG TPA: hypothetical protein VLQ89_06100 [Candidatus Binatia bacterium]|nr:hypothetical protein [Candidatus Binatia bacterium]
MLKKQQKWIAGLVILAFAWMMQVSTMPLAAASEQGPDFVEVTGAESAPAKSKSILPLVLIGVGVVAVAAVLFLVVLKSYDILGNWNVNWTFTSGYTGSGFGACTFTGTKKAGTVAGFYGDSGPYTVDGKNVTWTLSSYDPGFKWTGQFDGKDTMSGTVVLPAEGVNGTWTATRTAAPAVTGKGSWKRTVTK